MQQFKKFHQSKWYPLTLLIIYLVVLISYTIIAKLNMNLPANTHILIWISIASIIYIFLLGEFTHNYKVLIANNGTNAIITMQLIINQSEFKLHQILGYFAIFAFIYMCASFVYDTTDLFED